MGAKLCTVIRLLFREFHVSLREQSDLGHIVYNIGHQSTYIEEKADGNCCESQEKGYSFICMILVHCLSVSKKIL